MYKLIWKNSIESCMADAKFQSTHIKIISPDDHKYSNIVEVPLFLGWKDSKGVFYLNNLGIGFTSNEYSLLFGDNGGIKRVKKVSDLITEVVAKVGEKIEIKQFVRFSVTE